MKIWGKFNRFNFLLVLFFLVLLLSGCAAKERLQWLDNRIGEVLDEFQNKVGEEGKEPEQTKPMTGEDLTKELKEKIDQWLKDNNFNRYGDSLDTMYTGGTPLFNEATGESLDRFDYILSKHPDILEKIED